MNCFNCDNILPQERVELEVEDKVEIYCLDCFYGEFNVLDDVGKKLKKYYQKYRSLDFMFFTN